MSYAMTHLIIADRFASHYKLANRELFLAASIAPDAVHSRKDFTFDLKGAAHDLMPDAKWGKIYTEESMLAWYARLIRFYQERKALVSNQEEMAVLQGYTLHILVDIFNCKLLYAKNLIRYDFKVEEMREEYRRECILQDNYLFQNWEKTREVLALVKKGNEELICEEMLENLKLSEYISVQNMRDHFAYLSGEYEKAEVASLEGLEMVSVADSKVFLDRVTGECVRMRFDFPAPERTFKL